MTGLDRDRQRRLGIGPVGRRGLLVAALAGVVGCGEQKGLDATNQVVGELVDLSTCGAGNVAVNTTASGFPSPLDSDPGVAGSDDAWDVLDSALHYADPTRGLAFDRGGTHQVTVDFGRLVTLDELTVWQPPDGADPGSNMPAETVLEYHDGTQWWPVAGISRTQGLPVCGDGVVLYPEECDDANADDADGCTAECLAVPPPPPPSEPFHSYADIYSFPPLSAAKLRWSYDGDGANIFGRNSARLSQVVTGNYHSCALRETGEVLCWGLDQDGQLGDGNFLDAEPYGVATAVAVPGVDDAIALAAGSGHTCALRPSGEVLCWGSGYYGQLGNGNFYNTTEPPGLGTPVPVENLDDAVAIAAGYNHNCAIRAGGQVVCWGQGAYGQLGNGGLTNSAVPVSAFGIADAVGIAAGLGHTCAVRETGDVMCWGLGSNGQLGNGTTPFQSPIPGPVSGLSDAVAISCGYLHTCAVREGGTVACWGESPDGQLGAGPLVTESTTPVPVLGTDDAMSITAGDRHTCVVREGGLVSCWGRNSFGQLGNADASLASSSVPVAVSGLVDAALVEAGTNHTCALREAGEALCWGLGNFGQLGDGSYHPDPPNGVNQPFTVSGVPAFGSIVHEVTVNGCVEPVLPESISGDVATGGSLTTDGEGDGATLADPIETTVTTPNAGNVSIDEGPFGGATPDGFIIFNQQVQITAPSASSGNPLLLTFTIDASLLPAGTDVDDVAIFRDGVLVPDCTAPPSAIPDPCVVSRALVGDDAVLTVATTQASTWTFGVAIDSDRDGDGTLDGYDGCPDDPGKTAPAICGCGIPDVDSDSDGVLDCEDTCSDLPCGDGDQDGVDDDLDHCPSTAPGSVVNSDGCAISDLCPCEEERHGRRGRRNQTHVACVAKAAHEFRRAGLIGRFEQAMAVRGAAHSSCGHQHWRWFRHHHGRRHDR